MSETALPTGWVWTTIEEIVFQINSGFASGKHNKSENGIPHLRPMNISPKGNIDLSDVKYVEVSEYDALREGDVLFNNTNSPVWVGKTALIKKDSEWAYSNHMTRLRFYPDSINPAWIAHYLHYLALTGFFQMYCTNHVNQASINRTFLSTRVKLPLPPLAEQHRIVAEIEKQLTRLDAGVAALQRAQARLRRYKAAVLKAACEGRLVPQNPTDEPADVLLERILTERRQQWNGRGKYKEPQPPDTGDLPELPEGWVWATVEQIGATGEQAVLTGPFGSNLGRSDFIDSGVPVLTIGCLTEQGLSLGKAFFISDEKASELERYKVKSGDLLFSRMATVGRAGMVTTRFEDSIINYHLMRLRLAEDVINPSYFISYVRGSNVVVDYVREVNHGATRDGINTRQLLDLPVSLPPLAEQQRIVAEVERRLSVVEGVEAAIRANLKRAERLRQSILKQAFAGRLVTQDPADEPASVLLARIRAAKGNRKQLGLPGV